MALMRSSARTSDEESVGLPEERATKRSRIAEPVGESGVAMSIMQLHARLVGVEASLGDRLRTEQCVSCDRWAAAGFDNCCKFCPGRHSHRCPAIAFVAAPIEKAD